MILGVPWFNIELPHGADQRFCTVYDVLIYRKAIQGQLISRVAVLMNDFHLFDNG